MGTHYANGRTVIGVPESPRGPRSFEQLFTSTFGQLHALQEGFPRDGLLVVAVSGRERIAGYLHLPVGADPVFAVIGRHENCDLFLPEDVSVSLRHVLVQLRAADGNARVRLWDLDSEIGYQLEDGGTVRGSVADGPVFIRVGEYHLFMFPTGSLSPIPWGDDAASTWATFPERIYLETRLPSASRNRSSPRGRPERHADRPAKPACEASHTFITRAPMPLRCRPRRLRANHERLAMIDLWAPGSSTEFEVGDDDLERGVLIGRYLRCQLGSDADCMSRIHLFVVADGDEVWAVDTASTNGTRYLGNHVAAAGLGERAVLTLADFVRLRWRRLSR